MTSFLAHLDDSADVVVASDSNNLQLGTLVEHVSQPHSSHLGERIIPDNQLFNRVVACKVLAQILDTLVLQ